MSLYPPSVIDTSPKIAEYGVRYNNSTTSTDSTACVTILYDYEVTRNEDRYGVGFGITPTTTYWKDGERLDWRNMTAIDEPSTNIYFSYSQYNQISLTLKIDMLDDCFLYQTTTGKIFFAGKNSPYYGYANINDMPQA